MMCSKTYIVTRRVSFFLEAEIEAPSNLEASQEAEEIPITIQDVQMRYWNDDYEVETVSCTEQPELDESA